MGRRRGEPLAGDLPSDRRRQRKVLPSSVCFAATFSRRREKDADRESCYSTNPSSGPTGTIWVGLMVLWLQ